jgi:hypothetical protein
LLLPKVQSYKLDCSFSGAQGDVYTVRYGHTTRQGNQPIEGKREEFEMARDKKRPVIDPS